MKFLRENFDEATQKIDDYRSELDEFKDGAYKRLDDIYGEVIKMREEQKVIYSWTNFKTLPLVSS